MATFMLTWNPDDTPIDNGDYDHLVDLTEAGEMIPNPAAEERALVGPSAMGLCGADLKVLAGAIPVRYPRILSHEMIGTVVRPGPMALFPEGSRVLIDPGIACGHCSLCRIDRTHLCPNGALMGRDVDGGFADLVAVDESRLHLVPRSFRPRRRACSRCWGHACTP